MEKFGNRYRIQSARLKGWDYGSKGPYFITICTKNRVCYFGDIVRVETDNHPSLQHPASLPTTSLPNNPGSSVPTQLRSSVETQNLASLQQPTASLHKNKPQQANVYLNPTEIGTIAEQYWKQIPTHFPFVELHEFVVMPNHIHGVLSINNPEHKKWDPNKFGVQSKNLASIIRGFKASVKTYATKNNIDFHWQERYHDRVIRDEKEFQNISSYIHNNPRNWKKDEFFSI